MFNFYTNIVGTIPLKWAQNRKKRYSNDEIFLKNIEYMFKVYIKL